MDLGEITSSDKPVLALFIKDDNCTSVADMKKLTSKHVSVCFGKI